MPTPSSTGIPWSTPVAIQSPRYTSDQLNKLLTYYSRQRSTSMDRKTIDARISQHIVDMTGGIVERVLACCAVLDDDAHPFRTMKEVTLPYWEGRYPLFVAVRDQHMLAVYNHSYALLEPAYRDTFKVAAINGHIVVTDAKQLSMARA